jgi:hypothetical protein
VLFNLPSHSVAPHQLGYLPMPGTFSTPDFPTFCSSASWIPIPRVSSAAPSFCLTVIIVRARSTLTESAKRGVFLLYCLLTQALAHIYTPLQSYPPSPAAAASSRINRVQQFLDRREAQASRKVVSKAPPELYLQCTCLYLEGSSNAALSLLRESIQPCLFPPRTIYPFSSSASRLRQSRAPPPPPPIYRPRVALRYHAAQPLVPQVWMAELVMPCHANATHGLRERECDEADRQTDRQRHTHARERRELVFVAALWPAFALLDSHMQLWLARSPAYRNCRSEGAWASRVPRLPHTHPCSHAMLLHASIAPSHSRGTAAHCAREALAPLFLSAGPSVPAAATRLDHSRTSRATWPPKPSTICVLIFFFFWFNF